MPLVLSNTSLYAQHSLPSLPSLCLLFLQVSDSAALPCGAFLDLDFGLFSLVLLCTVRADSHKPGQTRGVTFLIPTTKYLAEAAKGGAGGLVRRAAGGN